MQKIFDVYNNSRRATRLRPAVSECFEYLKTMLSAQFCDVIRAVLMTRLRPAVSELFEIRKKVPYTRFYVSFARAVSAVRILFEFRKKMPQAHFYVNFGDRGKRS